MTHSTPNRDDELGVAYRDLVQASLHVDQAREALDKLGWTSAARDLGDDLATIRDLIHDLESYWTETGDQR